MTSLVFPVKEMLSWTITLPPPEHVPVSVQLSVTRLLLVEGDEEKKVTRDDRRDMTGTDSWLT